MNWCCSNKVEILFDELRERLFSSGDHPFRRRLLIVPSPGMKMWLERRFAEQIGVFAGVEVAYLEEGLEKLIGNRSPLPSIDVLKFLIFNEIGKILDTERELPLFQPIVRFLDYRPKKRDRRRMALASQLAGLFHQYSRYGRKLLEDPSGLGWQGVLFERVKREKKGGHLDLPSSAHLFAISFLSDLQLQALVELSSTIPLWFYHLSPCHLYWGDFLTHKETRSIEAKFKRREVRPGSLLELEEYLTEQNPLLSNLGKIGRKMFEHIEEMPTCERYAVREGVGEHPQYKALVAPDLEREAGKMTLLSAVQADLLFLRSPKEVVALEKDRTIQIHACTQSRRQVEVLKDLVIGLMGKEGIKPEDIVVMAPDITEFAPFIEREFEKEGIPWQVMELEGARIYSPLKSFIEFLDFIEGRFEALSFISLLEKSEVQEKWGFCREDVQKITDWIKEAGILWGKSVGDRERILNQAVVERGVEGTWAAGIEALLHAFVSKGSVSIDPSDGELLGQLIAFYRTLENKLHPPRDGRIQGVQEWSSYLLDLFATFFGNFEEEKNPLLEELLNFQRIAEELYHVRCSFDEIALTLRDKLERKRISLREHELSTIRFCSMLPMRAISARVIILLGMDDGAFPKRDISSSLNLLKGHQGADFCPQQTDYDRYLFLEILLSCRDYLIFLYNGISPEDGKASNPSLLLLELENYLDRAYLIDGGRFSEMFCYVHPATSFDKVYFQGGALQNYSESDFELAKALNAKKNPPFQPANKVKNDIQAVKDQIVRMRDLRLLTKNPLELLLREKHGVWIEDEKNKEIRVEENFELSSLQKAVISRNALFAPIDGLIKKEKERASFPPALFGKRELLSIEADVENMSEHLANFNMTKADIFTIELTEDVEHHEFQEGRLLIPPLVVNEIKIVGEIPLCSKGGILSWKKKTSSELVKMWPSWLVFRAVVEREQFSFETRLLFLEDGAFEEFPGAEPLQSLQKLLDYFFQAKVTPSPLIAEWVMHMMTKEEGFEKKVQASLSSAYFYNEHARRIFSEGRDFSPEFWKPVAIDVFGEVLAKE